MWSDIPCKIWKGAKNSQGYPHVTRNKKTVYVTRIVLEEKLGRPIRDGYCALHYCDTPACYEAEHLWEGTKSQNTRDAFAKGRMKSQGFSARNEALRKRKENA
jgi:hypothetical protein